MHPRHWRYYSSVAFKSVIRSPMIQFVAVSTIAVSLTVLCTAVMLMTNVDQVASQWSRGLGLVAFVSPTSSDTALQALANRVRGWTEVETVIVHSRARALADLKKTFGQDKRLLDGIDGSVLPASLEIVLTSPSRTNKIRAELAQRLETEPTLQQIERVDYGKDLVGRLAKVIELIRYGGVSVVLLVLLAVVFIISNTVRLTLFARRDEIDVMRLVGATRTFIRMPS